MADITFGSSISQTHCIMGFIAVLNIASEVTSSPSAT